MVTSHKHAEAALHSFISQDNALLITSAVFLFRGLLPVVPIF